ncbi:MobF family relaxase [Leucobacter chromiireducens]|uniref:Conjugal transfer protein n=1 Tax=Leucobacter chromiireducens subsp. solipictus TaxID=398235 RepID=A0ABS1SEC1_9MICO|nr:MobF family relaxase [Leucobacter chromiireducens]MBL3678896.1 conjugal transfer protein [Leucobacter chromiireducens subsp. solipictus]
MTVSMRIMSAGDGYKYLLRSVVAGDGDRSLATPLTRYYAEAGSPPGRWLGSGLTQLGEGRITPGEEVSEQQLQLLIGMGCDPVTGDPLGRAYPVYKTPAERIADRVEALDPDLGPASRAEAVAEIEAEEHGRGARKAVAGYDYTFSLPKSASVLWAVSDAGTQALIAEAHHAAIAEVIDFMEREVAATRVGMTGADGGAVAQVDTFGLVATAYDHYDSRSNDPHLHTHVVVSNKVKTVLDGRWRSLDGRPMHAATVALSELHEAIIADHLTRLLGVEWEARDRGRDRNPAWAIRTVPEEPMLEFSTRARQIDAEKDRLIAEYVQKHGRQPSAATIIKLRAQATLSTRPEKQVRSLADLTTEWRKRATTRLGREASEWAREAIPAAPVRVLRADDLPLDEIEKIGRAVMEAVGEKRSTWHRWNLTAEAARQTMEYRFATVRDREAVTGMVVDAAERASLRLTPPELASTPVRFQRPDGSSAFRPRHGTLYSSEALLDAEKRLLERSRILTGTKLPLALIEKVTRRPDREGRMLGPDQADALTRIAVSGRQLDLLVGPAGTGKTTAMLALRTAWEQQHGAGSVVGLAPSAVAAEVLAGDLGIKTENTARWWTLHIMTGRTFQAGQLVIVDEASLAGTLALDRITGAAAKACAKILLVGDYGQLQSPAAAGAFGLLAGDRHDTPELSTIHRFTHEWEKRASLRLRLGEPDVIDVYQDADRIIGGTTDDMTARAYEAWRADREAGIASILVSDSGEAVAALNLRARTELILADVVHPLRGEVTLSGGVQASVGDTVITRKNERKLRTRFSWVQNGNRWTITKVRRDGSVTVRPVGPDRGESIVLPADYVAQHLDLGYAVTAYRAQSVTVDTSHVLADPTMTRENLYVAFTRGKEANLAYVSTDTPDDAHAHPHEVEDIEEAARRVLYGVLHHSGAELSVHETIQAEQERWGSILQLAAEYETIATEAQHDRWATLIRTSGLTDTQTEAALSSEAFAALAAELRRAEANHHDVDRLFPRLAKARGFDDADDIASVLRWRLATVTQHPATNGRAAQAPRLIAGLITVADGITEPDMRQALAERHQLIEQRAAALAERATADGAPWVQALGARPDDPRKQEAWARYVRTVAAYRDRYGVTSDDALGPAPDGIAQTIDQARAAQAIQRARALTIQRERPKAAANALTRRGARSL